MQITKQTRLRLPIELNEIAPKDKQKRHDRTVEFCRSIVTTSFLPSLPALSDLFYRVWQAGTLTQNDRYQLQTFLLSEHLTESDYVLIDRLLHAVRRGWVVWTTDASRS